MDAKLIKVLEHYHLYDGDKAIATTIVGNPMLLPNISLKNCQAIELGYDLDELSRNYGNKDADITNDFGKGHREGCYMGYLAGFQKALEILGDKKYSEEDMLKSFSIGVFTEKEKGNHTFEYEEYIQSLQQTEWDVIIKTTCDGMVTGLCCSEVCDCNIIPKLDEDGCLILSQKLSKFATK